MSWNYRVIRKRMPQRSIEKYECEPFYFQIYEVFYDENGIPDGWTAEPICPLGDTFEELKKDFSFYKEALNKPVLEVSPDGLTLIEVKE